MKNEEKRVFALPHSRRARSAAPYLVGLARVDGRQKGQMGTGTLGKMKITKQSQMGNGGSGWGRG